MPKARKSDDAITSFRLGAEYRAQLDERVAQDDTNLSDYLRRVVVEHLEPSGYDQLTDDIEGVRQEVTGLRNDLRVVLEAVLLNVAKVPKEDVKTFVRQHLKRGEGG